MEVRLPGIPTSMLGTCLTGADKTLLRAENALVQAASQSKTGFGIMASWRTQVLGVLGVY